MDIISVQKAIESRSKRLEELAKEIADVSEKLAVMVVAYSSAESVANVKCRYLSGEKLAVLLRELPDIEDILSIQDIIKVGKLPASLIPKIAPGLCSKEALDLEVTKQKLKSLMVQRDAISATLNARQSIFRHLSHE